MSSCIIAASYALAFWVTVMLKGKRLSKVIAPHEPTVSDDEKAAEAEAEKANIVVVAAINVQSRSKV